MKPTYRPRFTHAELVALLDALYTARQMKGDPTADAELILKIERMALS